MNMNRRSFIKMTGVTALLALPVGVSPAMNRMARKGNRPDNVHHLNVARTELPGSASIGDMFVDSATGKLYVFMGSRWALV